MTVNQRALFRGLSTWLWLSLALGGVVQMIEIANAPESCVPNPFSDLGLEVCTTSSPTAYGGGLVVMAIIGLISVASAKGVLQRSTTAASDAAAAPQPSVVTPSADQALQPASPSASSHPAEIHEAPKSHGLRKPPAV
ncbi:hypothetical protein LCL87_03495 [Rhodococcus hoagii]|nr:hypothetical protein [Prescottella equi]